MKILYKEFQRDIYKCLVNILCVLVTVPTDEATDAICDAYKIARLTGIEKELDKIGGTEK